MTNRGSRSFRTAALLGASAVLFFLAVLPALAALDCPTQNPNGSIQCTSPNRWCGSTCRALPTCPSDTYGQLTEYECTACVCSCPTDRPNNCLSTAQRCQSTESSCAAAHKASVCDPTVGATAQICDPVGCLSGYTRCGANCIISSDPSCPAPGVWDPCTSTCAEKYVLSNPTGAQIPQAVSVQVKGDVSIAGNSVTGFGNLKLVPPDAGSNSGNIYMQSGKAIHVDNTGETTLNIGNWGSGSTGIKVGVYGKLCLNNGANCASDWPIPLSGNLGDTLRHNGTSFIANSFLYNDGAKIGIGTNAPAYVLDVRESAASPATAVVNINDKNSTDGTAKLWTGVRLSRGPGSGGDAGKGTEKWFIGVNGSDDILQIRRGGATTDLTINGSGYVTIGSATPNNYLRVTGLINFDPNGNTVLGELAGNGIGGGAASYNTVVGKRSGQAFTVGAAADTAVGYNSLGTNVSGTYNTAMGYHSGYGIQGNWNTAYGANALFTSNIGTMNTAIGIGAIYQGGGSYNSAVGYDALYKTTGDYNTSTGTYSLFNNTSGAYNTAFGAYSLYKNTTGQFNTAVGYYAQGNASNTAAISNTSAGDQSAYQVSGIDNTAVGRDACYFAGSMCAAVGFSSLVSGGDNNSAIGYYAGSLSGSASSFNTFLGSDTDASAAGLNLTYATAIGAHAQVSASHALVLGGVQPYEVNVGIGTKDPRFILDVRHNIGAAVVNINDRSSVAGEPKLWTGYRVSRGPGSGVDAGKGTEKWFLGMNSTSDNLMIWRNGSVADMTVDSATGRVGIGGAASATSTLNVTGIAEMNQAKITNGAVQNAVLTAVDATGLAQWKTAVFTTECSGGKFDHVTDNPYKGDLNGTSPGGFAGYKGANYLCGTGMHVCTPDEILRSVYCTSAVNASYKDLPSSGNAWINAGPNNYISSSANDCVGWTSNASSVYGSFWQFGGANGGRGWSVGCNIVTGLKFACCSTAIP
jgi:hypothetical protein